MIVDDSKYDIYDEHAILQMACFAIKHLRFWASTFGPHAKNKYPLVN
jgi:hypothetical protein